MIKINGNVIAQDRFPDETLFLRLDPLMATDPLEISWYYENDAELFTLICIAKYFKNAKSKILTMPYIPHARMDRVKNPEDVFTLKYFCEVINSLKFDAVFVLDAHSNVSLALLENVYQLEVMPHIDRALDQVDCGRTCIFYPDEGAMKRYSGMIPYPYAFGIKRRNWETGVIEGLDIMNKEAVKGKDILIIDDICSKGGTFYHSAKALKEAGAASISLYITHLEGSVFLGDLWASMTGPDPLVNRIYTANPLFSMPEASPNSKILQV